MPTNPSPATPTPTPAAPVAAPATPPPPAISPLTIGDSFIHNESANFYRIVGLAGEGENVIVVYARYGDNLQRRLNIHSFRERFRPASPEEIALLERALPSLVASRTAASSRSIEQVNATLAEIPAEAGAQASAPPPARRRQPRPDEESLSEPGVLVEPSANDTMENLILHKEAIEAVLTGVDSITRRPDLERVWNLSRIVPQSGRCVLNFYGPPGTGKTRCAKAIAQKLGKKLYQCDYSQIISRWYGHTAKHIQKAFVKAAEANAILFFDEADSLLSRRIDMSHDGATTVNQNRNVLMQELDRFNGIVIMSTNLFTNYDEAIVRRVNRHVNFALPNKEMREKLIKLHIPNLERCATGINWKALAEDTYGLSGGDILNVCVNSIESASRDPNPDLWYITQAILEKEVERVKSSKDENSKRNGKKRRVMGFNVQSQASSSVVSDGPISQLDD